MTIIMTLFAYRQDLFVEWRKLNSEQIIIIIIIIIIIYIFFNLILKKETVPIKKKIYIKKYQGK